jgi:hypothetical protein
MLKGSIKLNLSGAKIFYILKSKMWSGSIRKFVYFDKMNQFVERYMLGFSYECLEVQEQDLKHKMEAM